MFTVTIQVAAGEDPGVGDIDVFGPFTTQEEAETFAKLCDTFSLGYESWDPSYMTSTQVTEIQDPTVENLARNHDLYTEDEDGNPVTDSHGNPFPPSREEIGRAP